MYEECSKFVIDTFAKYDKNRSRVLERRELQNWIKEEINAHRYLKK